MAQNTQITAAGGALTQQQVADLLLLQPLQAKSVFLAAGPRIFATNGDNNRHRRRPDNAGSSPSPASRPSP